jgi:small subunit ribosomal protein S16
MAFYRIVVADSRSPRDGRFIEQLGYYDPLKEPADIKVDTEKVLDWFSKGAKPTETVKSLFSRIGIMETWHNVRQGKPYDELRHIEDEARKRMEASAAMLKRKKDEAKAAKKAAKAEEGELEPAADEAGSEATGAEEEAAEPAAEPQGEAEDGADSASEAETGGEETAETPEEAPAAEEATAEPDEAPASDEATAEPEETPATEEAAEPEPEKTEG